MKKPIMKQAGDLRETQFAGFAAMLLEELDKEIGKSAKPVNLNEKEFAQRLGLIIACRAYDLVEHVVRSANEHVTAARGCLFAPEDLFMIPDMDEWPEVTDERMWEHYANHQYDGVDFGEDEEDEE